MSFLKVEAKLSSLFILVLLYHDSLFSQINVEIGTSIHKLASHSEKFRFQPYGFGYGLNSTLLFQTDGSLDWNKVYGKPSMGIRCQFLNLGKPDQILGWALSLSPTLDLGFWSYKNMKLQFLISSGVAYHSKFYHYKNNPDQNAISSRWNNHTGFQFRFHYSLKSEKDLYFGICLDHLSNGGFRQPNLGLNFFGMNAGIQFRKENKFRSKTKDLKSYTTKAWNISGNYGVAFRESSTPGGPRFPVYIYGLDLGYPYRKYQLIRIGLETEYHQLAAYFASHTETQEDIKSARSVATRFQIYGSHEWLIGPITLETRLGYQLKKNAILAPFHLYGRLSCQYLIDIPWLDNLKIGFGAAIKAHYGKAEYLSLISSLRYYMNSKEKNTKATSLN